MYTCSIDVSRPSWLWSNSSWIYNYICNQGINIVNSKPAQARCTRYNIIWSSLSVTCGRSVVFSRYTTKTDRHDITNIVVSGVRHHYLPPLLFPRISNCCISLKYATNRMHAHISINRNHKTKYIPGFEDIICWMAWITWSSE